MEKKPQGLLKLIAQCWSDEDFKEQFIADPAPFLREEGIEIPAGMEVRAVENTPDEMTFVVPRQPEHMAAEEVDDAAGGSAEVCGWCFFGDKWP